jgi:hypothetical protein
MKFWTLLMTLICAASGASLPVNGLLMYYSFDSSSMTGTNQIKDLSPYNYSITSSAAVQLVNDRFGTRKSAVSMDGSYYFSRTMPDTTVAKMIDGDFTMGFMMRTTASSSEMSGRMDIMGMGDPYNSGFFLSLHDNRIRIFLGNHGYYDTRDSLNDGTWHMVAAKRFQGAVTLYIDGKASDSGAYTGSIDPKTSVFTIGKHGIKDESYYKGLLDDAFFYDKALASDDISTLYKILSGITFTLTTPSDTFSTGSKPFFTWRSIPNSIAYAVEVGNDSLFSAPGISVPLTDTTFTLSQSLSSGRYYMHIGANFDDRTPFFFGEPHAFVVR